jgi:Trypsin-like peptidase domain
MHMTNESPPTLGGEADPNSWDFESAGQEGPLPNPVGHTFPLLTHGPSGSWRLLGTGFYISSDGLFITARHVITPVLRDRRQIAPLVILHPLSETGLFGPSDVLYRPITQCWLGEQADVAFGVAAEATNNKTGEVLRHWCWPLSWATPAVGARVATYAFARHTLSEEGRAFHFQPELYRGNVLEAADYRDSAMVPFPYLSVDCRIHGAASGGPLVAGAGTVVGINCTELGKTLDHPPGPGTAAQVRCLKDAYIDDGMLVGETAARRIGFDELVRANCIRVDNYVVTKRERHGSGVSVRLNEIPVTAPHPRVSFTHHF